MSNAIARGSRLRGIVVSGALAGLAGCPASGSGTATTDAATTTGTTSTSTSTSTEPTTSGTVTTTSSTTTAVGTTGSSGTTTGTTTGIGTTGETSGGTTGGTTGDTTGSTTGSTTGGTTGDDEVDFGCADTTGGDTTGGDTDGPGVCACILDDDGKGGQPPSLPTCGKTLCWTVTATCKLSCNSSFMLDDPWDITCALTALRDRTPGIIRWELSEDGGQYEDHGYVLIRGDGTVIRRNWGQQDLDYVVADALSGTMPDACAFEQCLAAGSPRLRFDCMRQFPLDATVTCDDGWVNHGY